MKLGIQLWSLRDDYAKDFRATFKSIKEIGFDGIEPYGALSTYDADELRATLDELGLEVCGYHTPWEDITPDRIYATMDYMRRLGNKNIIVPYVQGVNAKGFQEYIDIFNKALPTLKAEGFRMGYHLHGQDVQTLDNGSFSWKMVGEGTPDEFIMQVDIGNCYGGGRDGVETYEMFASRGTTIHCKPFKKEADPDMHIGNDDVDWSRVISIAKKNNCEWAIVEIEKGASLGSEVIKLSEQTLRRLINE